MGLRSFFKPFFHRETLFALKNAPFAKSKIAAVRQHVCSAQRNGNKMLDPSKRCHVCDWSVYNVMCTQL